MTVIGMRVKEKVLAPTVTLTEESTLVNTIMANNTVLQTEVLIFREGKIDLQKWIFL